MPTAPSRPRIFPPVPRAVPWRNLNERLGAHLGEGERLDAVSAVPGQPLTGLHCAGLSGLGGSVCPISEIYRAWHEPGDIVIGVEIALIVRNANVPLELGKEANLMQACAR